MPGSTYPDQYQTLLAEKQARLEELVAPFSAPALEVFPSDPEHFRMRAEFRIRHEKEALHYVMHEKDDAGKTHQVKVSNFPIASTTICELMPKLLEEVSNNPVLRRKLFQIEFLTTLTGDALITLIYHKPIDEKWDQEAKALSSKLEVPLIGRARKIKRVLERDYVEETLTVNGAPYHYRQIEGGFSQPNAKVCEHMLSWAQQTAENCEGDLLELYCGNANFTIPLASQFNRVLATEISKTSVKAAHHNLEKNQISNVQIARMSSEEFTQAHNGVREFRRLEDSGIDLSSYDFQTLFVDPPRAGLDKETVSLAQDFKHIIYISCNPETLADNLKQLSTTHSIERFALFDQFPYTHHIESGVLLSKK